MGGFLSGLKVLDFCDDRGILAGWMLARLGAEVVAVESREGNPARYIDMPRGASWGFIWAAYAASKRSVCCDVTSPEGRELLLKMVREADIVIESPGALAELGLTYKELQAVNGRIIFASISAFGQSGCDAEVPATDLTVWARSGTLYPSRDLNNTPVRIGSDQAFLHAGADAAAAILIACAARDVTGQGQYIDVSAQQSASIATLSVTLASAVNHQNFQMPADAPKKKKSLDLSGSGSRTRRSKWPVKDGLLEMHLGMGPASGGSSNKLFAWMRENDALPEQFHDWDWVTLPKQILAEEIADSEVDAARDSVAAFLAGFTKAELLAIAMERGILMAPAMTMADIVSSEHHSARAYWQDVTDPGLKADIKLPRFFAVDELNGFPGAEAAPVLGADNARICQSWLGMETSELSALQQSGVLV